MAMEKAFGRYKATIQSISGVYSGEMKDRKALEEVQKLSDRFAELDGHFRSNLETARSDGRSDRGM